MSDYKGLALDKAKIAAAIAGFPGIEKVEGPTSGKGFDHYNLTIEGQPEKASLQVHYRADDLITLHYKVGKNQTASEQVAKHVAEHCQLGKVYEPKPLSLKKLSKDAWDFLLESLKADEFILTEEPLDHGLRFKVQGKSHTDVVYIHYYKTTNFLLQGQPRLAYAAVVHALTYGGAEQKELIDSQLKTLPITNTDSTNLLNDLEQLIPNAYPKMHATLATMLAPALLVNKISVDLGDYTIFVMPALRALEGCIKDVFGKKGFFGANGSYKIGDQFDNTGTVVALTRGAVKCNATCDAAEKLFTVFKAHRNGLMHVDTGIATTRVIEKQQEAKEIVYAALYAMNDAYALVA